MCRTDSNRWFNRSFLLHNLDISGQIDRFLICMRSVRSVWSVWSVWSSSGCRVGAVEPAWYQVYSYYCCGAGLDSSHGGGGCTFCLPSEAKCSHGLSSSSEPLLLIVYRSVRTILLLQALRGAIIVNRIYGTHKNLVYINILYMFTYNIWSYLLWPPAIAKKCSTG